MKHTITVIGNIGSDYKEGFATNESRSYTNMIFESMGKDKQSRCFNFTVWDKRADALRSYAPKGSLVALELDVTSKFGNGDNSKEIYTNFTVVGFKLLPNKNTKYDGKEPEGIKDNNQYHGKDDDSILWD